MSHEAEQSKQILTYGRLCLALRVRPEESLREAATRAMRWTRRRSALRRVATTIATMPADAEQWDILHAAAEDV